MTKVLVLYYSRYGHIQTMAEAVAQGASSVDDTLVDMRRVPDIYSVHDEQTDRDIPEDVISSPAALKEYDAIILGTPTHFGNMAAQMKHFIDRTSGLWMENALVGKVGAVFTSTGSQHGGHEAAILSSQIPLFHLGMVVVGMPYTFKHQTRADQIVGGSPYGAGTVAGLDGARQPSDIDLSGAFFQGRHVAEIAKRLHNLPVQ